eukprot:15442935-Alexandrium_andersonii.AAC.1
METNCAFPARGGVKRQHFGVPALGTYEWPAKRGPEQVPNSECAQCLGHFRCPDCRRSKLACS